MKGLGETPGTVSRSAPLDIWVLFDISNGMDGSKNYVWWFETRAKARRYRREIDRRRREGEGDRLARLVGPHKYSLSKLPAKIGKKRPGRHAPASDLW